MTVEIPDEVVEAFRTSWLYATDLDEHVSDRAIRAGLAAAYPNLVAAALRSLHAEIATKVGWSEVADWIDVRADELLAGAPSSSGTGTPPTSRVELRAAATGGGPCRCGKPFWTHVCLTCSPDAQTPGVGCHNCRSTGMDQTPCQPVVVAEPPGPTRRRPRRNLGEPIQGPDEPAHFASPEPGVGHG